MHLRADDLHIVEGVVSGLLVREGITQFQIGTQSFGLITSRTSAALRAGDVVRVLVDEPRDEPILEVLVLQRADLPHPEYTGPGASVILSVIAALGLALAVDAEVWWLLAPALLLGFLQLKFSMRKEHLLGRYAMLRKQMEPLAVPFALPLVAIPPADIPLTLPSPAVAAGMPPAGVPDKSASAAWPAQILEFTHDAIIIWELDGAGIVYWNRAAEQLYGYSRDQARGRVTHELLKTRRTAGTIGDLEAQVARYGVWVGDLRHTRSDGQVVEVEARLSLMSQEHRPWLVLEVNRDVTDRNRAEAAREEITKQLERARQQP